MCAGQLPLPLQVWVSTLFQTLLVPLEKGLIRIHQWGSLASGFPSASSNGRHQQEIRGRGHGGCASLPKTTALSGGPFL